MSTFSLSPDGGTLLVTTQINMTKQTAKALGIKDFTAAVHDYDPTLVVIAITGATGKVWAQTTSQGATCERYGSRITWSKTGKRAFIVSSQDDGMGAPHAFLVDVSKREILLEQADIEVLVSPGYSHLAAKNQYGGHVYEGKRTGDEIQIDGLGMWGNTQDESGFVAKDLAWLSDTKFQFCGSTKDTKLTKYQASLDKEGDWTVTSRGTCP